MCKPLSHFIRNAQVVQLYRNSLRVVAKAPIDSQAELRLEVRRQFQAGTTADESVHDFLLSQGRLRLIELEQMIHLARGN